MNYQKQHIDFLLLACKKKDQKAQMELYRRYHAPLYTVAFSIVKNEDDALDALQESFITAFKKIDQFQGEGSFEGWLRKIVTRKSIKVYHHNKRWLREESIENSIEHSIESEDEETLMETQHIQKDLLDRAMKEINERYRLILQLFYVEGYDHKEISEITGWSYSQCRTTLSRAKQQLKNKLQHA